MPNEKTQLPDIAAKALEGFLDRSGAILYSSHETIRPGVIYLMGLNPGGSEGHPLCKSISELLTKESNDYLDDIWETGKEPGDARLQRRVDWLLRELGFETRKVLATNLIFFQSKNEKGVSWLDAEKCWPVHEALIGIVKPKLLLVFGNSGFSPYQFIHSKYGGEQHYFPAGHGDWNLKDFSTEILGQRVVVAGLPHLSRYSPVGKSDVIKWIKNLREGM